MLDLEVNKCTSGKNAVALGIVANTTTCNDVLRVGSWASVVSSVVAVIVVKVVAGVVALERVVTGTTCLALVLKCKNCTL